MFDVEKIIKEKGFNEETYEKMLDELQAKTHRETDIDWSELSLKYNLKWSGDAIRKASQVPLIGGTFVKEYYEQKIAKNNCFNEDGYIKKLEEKKRDLQKERIKLQSEKVEYNKWLRENSRNEMIVEKIVNAISTLEPLPSPTPIYIKNDKREYLLCFSDSHYGSFFELKDLFGNIINSYSPEIFEQRMGYLLYQLIEIIKKENIRILNIFSLGDDIDGILRVSQLMKLRYGVVESTIKYSEYMSKWLNELSKYVKIKIQFVGGNHQQLRLINQPKGTFVEENMVKVMVEFIRERLKDNPNFKIVENPTGMAYAQLCCSTILGIHGEVKNMGRAIDEFSRVYGVPIDYLIGGHVHHSKSETIGINQEVINVPSIIGVDDYSLSLNKTSNAGATLLVFENLKGKVIEYDIKLN